MSETSGNAPSIGRLGRYEVGERLGVGGMAEVFQATDTTLGRKVAIKVIAPAYAADRQFRERFLREAKVVAALDHPHIVPIFDVGEEGGLPYLVMPLVPGGTLAGRLRQGPLPLGQAVSWIAQLASALDAAHQAGILHRDIKPGNVLIGQNGRLLLADFGIAHLGEGATRLTRTGMVVGTPVYMAPEIAQGHSAQPASDLYSLAVMAFEMIAGRPPFDGENVLSILHQHATQTPPALRTLVAQLPEGIDPVIAGALAKNPTERPSTCTLFAEHLLQQMPTEARPAMSSGSMSLTSTPPPSAQLAWNATTMVAPATPAPTLEATLEGPTLERPRSSAAVEVPGPPAANPAPATTSAAPDPPRAGGRTALALVALVCLALAAAVFLLRPRGTEETAASVAGPASGAQAEPNALVQEPAAAPAAAAVEAPARVSPNPLVATPPAPPRVDDAPPPPASAAGTDSAVSPPEGEGELSPATSPEATRPPLVRPPNFEYVTLMNELARMPKLAALRRFTERPTAEVFQRAQAALAAERQHGGQRATLFEPLARFAAGGLAYAQGNEARARETLSSLLNDRRFVMFLGASPQLMLTPEERPPGPLAEWELALAYGDVRRVAATQLAAARPAGKPEPRQQLARSVIHRLDREDRPALELATEAYAQLLPTQPALAAVAALQVADLHLANGNTEQAANWYGSAIKIPTSHQSVVILQTIVDLREKAHPELAQTLLARACALGFAAACKNANERPIAERPRRRPG